ncbi:MAG: xanthine dehydrogenase family protein subunit M [Candidatus Thermoplasmatota archaeon]|jgi:carbon-monoxide dehydrogenase medium subunit|nr:xanthine dehydrogenase family protein subunit M [Candidatus Thermoplasmatota archaeon]MCL5955174.1 xanthine dehydrogenase family protein subunit M [Candidatus Thermoplasmatota archaeon]
MNPPAFEYFAPTGIDEVIDILAKYPGEAKILAGGQSLIPLLKARISSIPYLVSLSEVKGLSYVDEGKEGVRIGAMTVDSDIENSELIRKKFPVLHDATEQLADPLVRNVGTIGGNLSHADPANDLPAVMIALDARISVQGRNGLREIKARDFFLDTFTTALEAEEVLTEVTIPFWGKRSGGAYVKFKKNTWNFSVAAVAVQLELEGNKCTRANIATTSVSAKSGRMESAEKILAGKELTHEVISKAASEVAASAQPTSDPYGTEDYKREILKRITREAIRKALSRAGEN